MALHSPAVLDNGCCCCCCCWRETADYKQLQQRVNNNNNLLRSGDDRHWAKVGQKYSSSGGSNSTLHSSLSFSKIAHCPAINHTHIRSKLLHIFFSLNLFLLLPLSVALCTVSICLKSKVASRRKVNWEGYTALQFNSFSGSKCQMM